MGESADRTGSNAEQLAHARPVVERGLVWTGLVPLPAFLLLHLVSELRLSFASDVSEVLRAAPSPFMRVISVIFVWLPLALHVGIAALRRLGGRASPAPPHDVPGSSRALSRLCALLALAFLGYHAQVFAVSVWLGHAAAEDAGFRLLTELSSTHAGVPLIGGSYLLGLLATVTHAALGVHRGLLLEGHLATPARREASARSCAAIGAALFCVGAAAVIRVASGVLLR